MLDSYALYSTELTDEERELGFELVEIQSGTFANQSRSILAVAYRFSEADQIVKMNVPVVGGYSYRHERLRVPPSGESNWVPVGTCVFPTAGLAVNSIGNSQPSLQMCR